MITQTLKQCRRMLVVLPFLLFLSCHNYYKVRKSAAVQPKADSLIQANPHRYFILRSGPDAFYMNHVLMSSDRKSLTCMLDTLPPEHRLHLHHGRGGRFRFKKLKPEAAVLNEVHFYIPQDSTAQAGNTYTLDLGKIQKMEILTKDKGRTTESYILGGVGITVGIVAIAGIIALASSCPYVSANDGNGLSLQGEIYGGAIYPQLARNDYLQLKMTPMAGGNLQVRISNELKERQYTDIAELLVVTHPKGIQMRIDENGRIYSVSNPQLPLDAKAGSLNILNLLKTADDQQVYAFDDTTQQNGNRVELTFNKPATAKKAKLILKLKNSYWLDLIYGKMTEGFGAYYTKFIQDQHSRPVEELKKWTREQQLPLNVSIETAVGWRPVEEITTFGPLANRETVIPLNLDSISGNVFSVRLSSGFKFWELDYAAVDFSRPADYELSVLSPQKAVDETGRDMTALLRTADGIYLEQPVPGNSVDIAFAGMPLRDSSKTQTFFLHAKGYYEHVRNYPGAPKIAFLKQFTKPNALSQYSREMYRNIMNDGIPNLAAAGPVVTTHQNTDQ